MECFAMVTPINPDPGGSTNRNNHQTIEETLRTTITTKTSKNKKSAYKENKSTSSPVKHLTERTPHKEYALALTEFLPVTQVLQGVYTICSPYLSTY